jgi:molecular chaperone DnaK (HSP70)
MAGRLAIDFGTCNTVIALWDTTRRQGLPLHLADYARMDAQGNEQVALIPSVIHYGADGKHKIANQVFAENVYHSERTFRWMKRYIMQRNPGRQRVNGRDISHYDAGADFLKQVCARAAAHAKLNGEEIAFTVPVESFEHYEKWFADVLEAAHMPRFRIIDEPSAAAIGYGIALTPGDVYLVFDFGCGTLDVAVIIIEADAHSQYGCRCRVLGKAGAEVGGALIDQWLYQHVLQLNQCAADDETTRAISRHLLVECERAKERLSAEQQAAISVMNPYTGAVVEAEISRSAFEEILDKNDLFTLIGQTLRRALNASRERGYAEDNIKATLMVGGSSMIPSVQRALHQIFGRQRVQLNRPLDAVARGAAAFVAGVQFVDHIQHDYAIRYVDAHNGGHSYRTLVKRGTRYPTEIPEFFISATNDYQTKMGLPIFEISDSGRAEANAGVELEFDSSGHARLITTNNLVRQNRNYFWMNEHQQFAIDSNPPARKGQSVFKLKFGVDKNKRLLVTVVDVRSGATLHQDYPVVKLS